MRHAASTVAEHVDLNRDPVAVIPGFSVESGKFRVYSYQQGVPYSTGTSTRQDDWAGGPAGYSRQDAWQDQATGLTRQAGPGEGRTL